MHLSGERLLVILLVGVIAGWLAGKIVRGAGLGILGDLVVGILGAFIGNWVVPRLGIHLAAGIVGCRAFCRTHRHSRGRQADR